MPLLAVEPKAKSHKFNVELDGNTAENLRLYSAFANNAKENSIIREALNHVFNADTEFQNWKKNPENAKATERRPRRKNNGNGNGTTPAAAK